MKKTSRIIAASLALVGSTLTAQVYPLSENTWSNPDFVKRFMGSYGFDTEKTPSVTKEEAAVFQQVANVAASNTSAAISLIRNALTSESSGAMDFALANFLLQQNNQGSAIASYKNAIRKFPNFGRAYKNLGLAYIQQGNYKEALPNLTKSLEILGGDGGMFGLIGFCHLNLERYGPALDAYRFALVYQPESRDWRLGQLKALQSLRRYDEVEAIIYRYIKEKPDEPEFWLQQANAFIAQRKYAEAAANFEVVKMLGAADSEMLVLLGDIYVNMQAPSLALEPYEKAIGTGKVKAENALDLAKVLSRVLPATELKTFLEMLDKAYSGQLSQSSELTLLTLKAGNALAMNQKETAMTLLGQVVAKDPLNGSALLTLGSYYYGENELVKSLDYYSRAEKVKEAKMEALLGSARVLVKQNKYQEAIYRLKEAQVINDQPFIAQYINTLQKFIN
ncbi:tetratricopeptide repeat protein [Coraliomargarita parva]|uniref:tetratricopeptide repeat protein n=1 Tax=Coraliomargarita parva TaxID=3014050 RepID=UPI0022B3524F|nr:tetratricopeptide repeat protein [Coraliomargarita parva]